MVNGRMQGLQSGQDGQRLVSFCRYLKESVWWWAVRKSDIV